MAVKKRRKIILSMFVLSLVYFLGFWCSQSMAIVESIKRTIEYAETSKVKNNGIVYSNPIDEYYLPLIKNAESQIERREHQDNYGGAWKLEYENIIDWMKDKSLYQVDIEKLNEYDAAVNVLIDATCAVLITDWLDDCELLPNSSNRYSWGTGTRSGLNQKIGEIYCDAGMRLISHNGDYIFIEHDYESLNYEGILLWDKQDTILVSE